MNISITATEIRNLGTPAQWRREEDGEVTTVAIVKAPRSKTRAALGYRTPYLVQITDEQDKHLIGIYDLDGDQIDPVQVGEWSMPPEAGSLPNDVYEHVEQAWESGASTMTRL